MEIRESLRWRVSDNPQSYCQTGPDPVIKVRFTAPAVMPAALLPDREAAQAT
jgi:hypothetical protein